MPRLVIGSLLLLIFLSYAMFFASWNLQPVKVVGLQYGGQQYWDEVPVAYLPLAGVAIGVFAMAIAALLQWQGQRQAMASLRAQIERMKSQQEKARQVIEKQKQRISELEAALAEAQTLASSSAEALAEKEEVGIELEPEPPAASEEQQTEEKAAADDDEII